MPHTFHSIRPPAREETGRKGKGEVAPADYGRIATALVGASSFQLAAHLGEAAQSRRTPATTRPTRSREELCFALRAVIGTYYGYLEIEGDPAGAVASGAGELEHLVQVYLGLRSEWENREARRLVASMSGVAATEESRRPAATTGAAPLASGDPMRRRALLVDDASDILVTVGAFLGAFGFDVERVSNGDMALGIVTAGTPIDLLVTDHAMPGLSGRDLTVQARERRPSLRSIIITGYPDVEELAALPPGVALLAKPFRRAELSACIKELFAAVEPVAPAEAA